jgi:uncharacterized protein
MTTRDRAPAGAPCWADLWTSDVEGSRQFYSELFGWEAQEPSPEFGGYFMWTLDGVPVAGGMGDMGPDLPAQNVWKIYAETDDITRTLAAAVEAGATIVAEQAPVADLGVQAVLMDPTGAQLGAWQPGTFPGFTVLGEPGTPSWFELYTRDHARAVSFYRSVFRWETRSVSDTDEFRYDVMADPGGDGELAGIMDASGFLPEGVPSHWSVYWHVADVDVTATQVEALGGSIVMGPHDTPYGRLVGATDPWGAQFRLRTPPKG